MSWKEKCGLPSYKGLTCSIINSFDVRIKDVDVGGVHMDKAFLNVSIIKEYIKINNEGRDIDVKRFYGRIVDLNDKTDEIPIPIYTEDYPSISDFAKAYYDDVIYKPCIEDLEETAREFKSQKEENKND